MSFQPLSISYSNAYIITHLTLSLSIYFFIVSSLYFNLIYFIQKQKIEMKNPFCNLTCRIVCACTCICVRAHACVSCVRVCVYVCARARAPSAHAGRCGCVCVCVCVHLRVCVRSTHFKFSNQKFV